MSMKFVKGMVIGGLISAGVAMMCSETMQPSRKKMVKNDGSVYLKNR